MEVPEIEPDSVTTGDENWADVQEKDLTEASLGSNHVKLKRLTTAIFVTLIVTSVSATILYLTFWFSIEQIEQLTNTFSAFFGFMAANVITTIGSFWGIVNLNDTRRYDNLHSNAVLWLLTSGILFNIIFPTLALIPFDSEGSKRVPTLSLQECFQKPQPPECFDAKNLTTALYCMYIPILLELAALIFYYFVWRHKSMTMMAPELSPCIGDIVQVPKCGVGDRTDSSASFSDFY